MTQQLTTEPALMRATITVTRAKTGDIEHFNMLVSPEGDLSFEKILPEEQNQDNSQGE